MTQLHKLLVTYFNVVQEMKSHWINLNEEKIKDNIMQAILKIFILMLKIYDF